MRNQASRNKSTGIRWSMICLLFLLVFTLPVHAQLAAGKSKFVGNCTQGNVPTGYAGYWNQVTPETMGKWDAIEQTRDMMNWTRIDAIYNYAKSNGMFFTYNALVNSGSMGAWLSSLSYAEIKAEAEEWIKAVCTRYPGIDMIYAVSEPMHMRPFYWYALGGEGDTGWDWVIWTFTTARKYTNAKLMLNDYNVTNDSESTDKFMAIVDLLKDRGLIDAIGDECHGYETVDIETLRPNFEKLATAQLPIYITEYDVQGNDATQLRIYAEQFPFLYELPAVKGITVWGYIQGQTWQYSTWLLSTDGVERPALQWLKAYLSSDPIGVRGDVNADGSVTIVDALMTAQYYVGLNPQGFHPEKADASCDGAINIIDALLIAQYYVGLIAGFC